MDGVTVEAPVTEEVADAATEQAEVVSDAAVQIAEIQADAAVTIAADINDTAVELAQIEADENEDDLSWLRDQLGALQVSHASHAERLETLNNHCLALLNNQERLLTLIPPSTPVETEISIIAVENPENVNVENTPAEPERPRRRWM